MQKISKRDAEMQAHDAWIERMRERNFEKYGWSPSEVGISWTKPRLCLKADSHQPTLDDDALRLMVPDDCIVHLTVRSNQITDQGLQTIANFSTLRELTIESNRVTDRGVADLARLMNLKRLTLKCPQVTEESLAVFCRFPARTCIAVESEQIPEEVAQQFGRKHYNVSFPPRRGVAACCLR